MEGKNKYTFSIIIPTYNRKTFLLDTLNFILKQTVKPVEIIVVDASASEFQLDELSQQNFRPLLKYIKWNEFGNISKQRNYGISIARGNYILFLDDDVIFTADLIENYIKAFNATGADAISGIVETTKYRFGSAPIRFKGLLSSFGEDNLQPCDVVAPTKLICTASFAVKTLALTAIGGFDEDQRGSYDDVEVGFRLAKKGFTVLHHSLPKIFHLQAEASGARDEAHGNKWGIENQVYFQIKHRYQNKKRLFLLLLLFDLYKPSRAWLHPKRLIHKTNVYFSAFQRSVRIIK